MKQFIKKVIYICRFLLIFPGVNWKDDKFLADLHRWKQILKIETNDFNTLAQLLWKFPEYRNLFIFRNRTRLLFRIWVKMIYPPMSTLFLEAGEIGGGLYIQHGFSTMIAAKSIGENCWINQQVSVGYTGEGTPIIGNNVMITCGAKVLGNIRIGDNVIIGANAVVIRNVESNSVMGGVPAHKLR